MPIFEYYCLNCEHSLELIISHKEAEEIVYCPVCGNEIKRIMSPSNFHLKGTGWYETDYKSN